MVTDTLHWCPIWTIDKYDESGKHYDHVQFEHNLLLNEGITELLKLLVGDTATAYSAANARLGVGTDTTAAAATQTALLANGVWVAMDGTYPQVSNQTVTFRATFDGSTANQSWQEFSVDNGSSANKNLNRKVSDQGTKNSGQVWVLTLTITLS